MRHEWEDKSEYLKQCRRCKGCRIKHPITGSVRHVTADFHELPSECQGEFPRYGKGPREPTIPPPMADPFEREAKADVFRRAWVTSSPDRPVKLLIKTGGGLVAPAEWQKESAVVLRCWIGHNPMSATDDALFIGFGDRGVIRDCAVPWDQVLGILFAGCCVMFGREQGTDPEPKPEPKPEPRGHVINLADRRRKRAGKGAA